MVGLECNLNLLVYKEECILVQEVYEVTKGPVQFSSVTALITAVITGECGL